MVVIIRDSKDLISQVEMAANHHSVAVLAPQLRHSALSRCKTNVTQFIIHSA